MSSTVHSQQPRANALWDPLSTFKITPHQCFGTAPSKKRDCTKPISLANSKSANELLRSISTRQPNPDSLSSDLYRIARYGLCVDKRYKHQDQADTLVQKWKCQILEAYPNRVIDSSNEAAPATREANAPSLSAVERGTASARAGATSSGRTDLRLEAVGQAIRQLLVSLDELSTSEDSPASSHTPVSATELFPLNNSESSSNSAPPAPPINGHSPTSASSHSTHSHSSIASSTESSCSLNAAHVARRSPDTECPICQESISNLSQLTWCKAGCGKSMCTECVESWRTAKISEWSEQEHDGVDMSFSCVLCRTEWVDCDCDN